MSSDGESDVYPPPGVGGAAVPVALGRRGGVW